MELNTKFQMLDSIRAYRARWDALLAEVGEERMLEPGAMGSWTFKDVAAHLTGWRERTIDRLEAAQEDGPLRPPPWPPELDEVDDDDVQINKWIYAHNRDRSLSDVLADARESWRRMEAAVEALSLSERDLTDPNRFSWMNGYAICEVVPGSSGHFEEHEEMVRAWLGEAQ